MSAMLLFALPLVVASAQAGEVGPYVHVENEVGTHVAVVRVDGEPATACVAPCDRFIAPGTYRLSSDAFRSSNTFHVSAVARNVDVQIRETGRSKLTSAIVLLTVSGLFAAGGASAIGYLATRGTLDVGLAMGISIPLFTTAVATGIPGALLLGSAIESKATIIESDRPAQPVPSGRATFVAPLLSGSF